MDPWDKGISYFQYSVRNNINYYLITSNAGDGTWIVCGEYIDDYEENIYFNLYASGCENSTAYRANSITRREDSVLVYGTGLL